MSCNSPIDIKTTTKICDSTCNYKYQYGNSSCMLGNKGMYVSLKLESTNTVKFSDTNYNLLDARIYKPSLHTWAGNHAEAELILNHKGASSNLFICIPIKQTDAVSDSSKWFKQFMKFVPTNTRSDPISVSTKNFTLNDVVPQGSYYYYIGNSPWCSSNDTGGPSNNIIVFDKNSHSFINKSDFAHLRISSANQTVYKPQTNNLFYNATGTKNGPGTSGSKNTDVIDCYPVDMDGKRITGDAAAVQKSSSTPTVSYNDIPPWFWTFIAVFGGILVFFIIYFVCKKFFGATKPAAAAPPGALAFKVGKKN